MTQGKRFRRGRWGVLPLLMLAGSGVSFADRMSGLTLQPPATKLAERVYDLHNLMVLICVVIFIVVFGVMFYSIYAHRKSKGAVPAQFHENTRVEVLWTVIPLLVLLGMAWPATHTLLDMRDASNSDITIKATGYQWKWGYDYLNGEGAGIRFYSNMSTPREQITNQAPKGEHYLIEVDNPIVVPVGKKVRILTTADDVIHSWSIPAFGIKQDAIPGFIRDTWFRAEKEGTYRGQCSELCGKDHGFMPIVVEVVSAEKYTAWVNDQKKKLAAVQDDPNKNYSMDELMSRGAKLYAANCVACHQANGKGAPPAFPPLDGSHVVTGPKAGELAIVVNGGRPGTAMPAWGKQLNDVEIAAVATYTRNTWGNRVGDTVQPAEVKTARK